MVWSLLKSGYAVVAAAEHTERARLATMRLRPPIEGAAIVDLLFASSGIEPEIASSAVELEVLPSLIAPVATIGHLLAMKMLARDDRRRPQDWDDLRALTGLASQRDLDQARTAMELITTRGYARGRELVSDFDALLDEFD